MLVRKKHLVDHHCFPLDFPSDGSGGSHYSAHYRLTATLTGTVLRSRQKCGMAYHLGRSYRTLVVWLGIVPSHHNQFQQEIYEIKTC